MNSLVNVITQVVTDTLENADRMLGGVSDSLARQFTVTDPGFYADYQNARTIVEPAGGHRRQARAARRRGVKAGGLRNGVEKWDGGGARSLPG